MSNVPLMIIVLSILINTEQFSQNESTLSAKIEHTIENYLDSLQIPGISIAVFSNGETLYKNSLGYSNLEYNIPMTDSSVYRIWSISKQICAVAILKLYQEGRINLNDRIEGYLDMIPDTWKNITIEQLLNHTAGIKDYLNNYPEGKKLNGYAFSEVMDSTSALLFNPGEDWSYSNTGYWVLAKIIEKVTLKDYQSYIQNEFFEPFGMKNTEKMDFKKIIKNRVSGYRQVEGAQQNSTRYLDENHVADGDGELVSTLNDLSIWTNNLFSEKIIKRQTLEKAWQKAELENGDPVSGSWIIFYDSTASYGMGWFISHLNGKKIIWTPGAGRGFSTTIFSVPEENINIIVLSNTRRFLIADRIAKQIAELILNK